MAEACTKLIVTMSTPAPAPLSAVSAADNEDPLGRYAWAIEMENDPEYNQITLQGMAECLLLFVFLIGCVSFLEPIAMGTSKVYDVMAKACRGYQNICYYFYYHLFPKAPPEKLQEGEENKKREKQGGKKKKRG